jgi:hypothetical protein
MRHIGKNQAVSPLERRTETVFTYHIAGLPENPAWPAM